MTEPERPVPLKAAELTWILGIVGGVVVSAVAVYVGGDDPENTRRFATGFGVWAIRLLILGGIVAGGWGAWRAKAKLPPSTTVSKRSGV